MSWLDDSGDRDGDGLQEYGTRSQPRLLQPGLEGRRRRDPARGRDARAAAHRAASSRATRMTPSCGWPSCYDRPETTEGRGAPARPGEAALRALQRSLLVGVEGTYYLGLDGAKKPIRAWPPTPGTCSGPAIVPPDRAGRMVPRLMAPDMWSGWGIRTLSSEHIGYNPFSYHPARSGRTTTSMIAAGFQQYGFHEEVARMARGLFEAAERFQAHRLPELFAGLAREPASFPVQYLGANVPQAWAPGPWCDLSRRSPASRPVPRLVARGSTSIQGCQRGCPRYVSAACAQDGAP